MALTTCDRRYCLERIPTPKKTKLQRAAADQARATRSQEGRASGPCGDLYSRRTHRQAADPRLARADRQFRRGDSFPRCGQDLIGAPERTLLSRLSPQRVLKNSWQASC